MGTPRYWELGTMRRMRIHFSTEGPAPVQMVLPTFAGVSFSCSPSTFDVIGVFRKLGGHLMEIVLALIIGLAVACAVVLLGRVLVGSGSASDQPHRPEVAIPASVSAVAAANPLENVVVETETAREAKPVSDPPDMEPVSDPPDIKAPKKARRASIARSQEHLAKTPRRPRVRKTKEAIAPGAHIHDAESKISEGPEPP
jgi:hypothetical protein